jgi:hypothetical protein
MLKADSIRRLRRAALIGCAVVWLVACQAQDAPAKAIERYLQAVVAKDPDRAVTSSCAAWETQARQEVDSLKAVGATLKNATCHTSGDNGDAKLISCTGSIVATYNNENREISLDAKTYRATLEGGDWRMCGYH